MRAGAVGGERLGKPYPTATVGEARRSGKSARKAKVWHKLERIADLTNDGDCNCGRDPVNGNRLPYPARPPFAVPFIGSA